MLPFSFQPVKCATKATTGKTSTNTPHITPTSNSFEVLEDIDDDCGDATEDNNNITLPNISNDMATNQKDNHNNDTTINASEANNANSISFLMENSSNVTTTLYATNLAGGIHLNVRQQRTQLIQLVGIRSILQQQ